VIYAKRRLRRIVGAYLLRDGVDFVSVVHLHWVYYTSVA